MRRWRWPAHQRVAATATPSAWDHRRQDALAKIANPVRRYPTLRPMPRRATSPRARLSGQIVRRRIANPVHIQLTPGRVQCCAQDPRATGPASRSYGPHTHQSAG